MRDYMISIIKKYQHYGENVLETMDDKQLREVFENILEWLE